MIHDEVLRQIHNYSDDMRRKQEVDENIPIDKRKDKVKDKYLNDKKKNKDIDIKIEPNKDSDEYEPENSMDKNDPDIDEGKVVIDGKEKKHSKHNKHFFITKPDADKTENIPEDVNLENIYGNSVGNEHVTNIFVFYPKENLGKPRNKINGDKLIESQSNLELVTKKEIQSDPNDLDKTSTSDNSQEKDTPHKTDEGSQVAAINNEQKDASSLREPDYEPDVRKVSSQEKNTNEEDKPKYETGEIELTPFSDPKDKESEKDEI